MTLTIRRPWNRQPEYAAGVNLSHWAARDLVSWLPGNGLFYDAARMASVTTEGGPAFAALSLAPHAIAQAVNWDGSNDGASAGVLPAFGDLTVTAWVNLSTSSLTTSYHGLISRGGVFENSTNFCFGFRWTGTEMRAFLYARTSGGTLQGAETSAASVGPGIKRIVATRTGSATVFYLNGAQHYSGSGSTGNDGGQELRYGRPNTFTTTDARFVGEACDLRVYRRVWSATEAAQDYREGPYALFAPRRIIVPVSVAADPGTGSITQADGVATTSTLTGSSVAATTPTQADGVATAASLTGSSIAAASFTQADGVATGETLVGSDAGGSAITSADGVATTATLAGSSIVAADFVAAAGTSTGETFVPFGAVVASSAPIGGGIPKRRRRRYQVEVDGEVFDVDSPAEAEAVLEQVKQTAQEQAKTAVERAAKATKREPRKVLQDARRAMPEPVIDAPAELADSIARVQSEIRSIYADALRDVEIALLMRRAELEADDEDVLLLL